MRFMDRVGRHALWRLLCSVLNILIALYAAPCALAATTPGPSGSTVTIGGGRIDVSCDNAGLQVSCQNMLAWVRSSALAVTTYYGRFPVASLRVRILPAAGIRDIPAPPLAGAALSSGSSWAASLPAATCARTG
jgi:hypothetical protein